MTRLFNDAKGFEWNPSDQIISDVKGILKDSQNGKKKLKVTIDATHSGVLTNGRVYPYREVKDAYKSFFPVENGGTGKYAAPVLTHHDEYRDPIGRIVRADYRTLKSGAELEYDYENPESVGERGSGVVTVEAHILDEDSIEKVLDGRYFTVSVGFSAKDMACSICGNSIFGRKCDHIPMQRYDEEGEPDENGPYLCYGITDGIKYRELSFVNTPAQAVSQVKSFRWEDAKGSEDSLKTCLVSMQQFSESQIKQAMLITDKLEFDLLSGKESRQKEVKYSIAPTAQKKLKNILSDVKAESTSNDHPESSGEQTQTETIEISNNKGETTMADIDNKTLEKTVASLTEEKDNLGKELATAQDRIKELEKAVQEKDTQIETSKSEVQELKTTVADMLATAVATLRVRLNKPDTKGIDSDDARKAYVEKLAKRSIESLRDSLADLTLESESTEQGKNLLNVDKVTSPVLTEGPKPTVKPEVVKKTNVSLESLFN